MRFPDESETSTVVFSAVMKVTLGMVIWCVAGGTPGRGESSFLQMGNLGRSALNTRGGTRGKVSCC